MSKDLSDQFHMNLDIKDTEELVDIWQKNNHLEWSELAFSAVQEILLKRLGELPPQDKPIWKEDDIQVEEDNDPAFYDPDDVMGLEKWVGKLALITLITSTTINLIQPPAVFSALSNRLESDLVSSVVLIIGTLFTIAVQVIMVYIPLKALSAILRILMEMEFNSRKVLDTGSSEDNVAAEE